MSGYTCRYFKIHELIHPNMYASLSKSGSLGNAWAALDDRLLVTIDRLRDRFGSAVINNWYAAGSNGSYSVRSGAFVDSGLRDMNSSTGAALSQHKFGRGVDLKFSNHKAEDVRTLMSELGCFKDGEWRNDPDPKYDPFRLIHRVEWKSKGVPITWFHLDFSAMVDPRGPIYRVNV